MSRNEQKLSNFMWWRKSGGMQIYRQMAENRFQTERKHLLSCIAKNPWIYAPPDLRYHIQLRSLLLTVAPEI